MTAKKHQMVIPIIAEAIHKTTKNLVMVISTSVINTTKNDNEGDLMVLYTDGSSLFTKLASEFHERYEVKNTSVEE